MRYSHLLFIFDGIQPTVVGLMDTNRLRDKLYVDDRPTSKNDCVCHDRGHSVYGIASFLPRPVRTNKSPH